MEMHTIQHSSQEINLNSVNYELILNFVSDSSVPQQPLVQNTTSSNEDLINNTCNIIRELTGTGYKYIGFSIYGKHYMLVGNV